MTPPCSSLSDRAEPPRDSSNSFPPDWVVPSVYRVDDGKLHQRQKYEDGADQEPDVDPLDIDHTGDLVIYILVQVDISQPTASACNSVTEL